jgi:short-subunit dehydrogenase
MMSSNKKVVIIGASSGIGRALVECYLQDGCSVGISGRRGNLLDEVSLLFPGQVEIAIFDVMMPDCVLHLENLIARMGGMDVFIYNAGFGDISEGLDWSVDNKTILTNVNGFAAMTNYAYNYFEKQGYGQIAATSSIASMAGNAAAPAYSASKAFMSTYMEGLFLKAKKARLRIAITDIQPGFVKTPMAKGAGRFWEAPVQKAASQVKMAIDQKKFRVYITRRWWMIAQLINLLPGWLYRKIG